MTDFSCSNCAAPRDIGHVVCGYCRRPYDAATAASAIPCGAGGKHDQSSKVDYSVAYDDE